MLRVWLGTGTLGWACVRQEIKEPDQVQKNTVNTPGVRTQQGGKTTDEASTGTSALRHRSGKGLRSGATEPERPGVDGEFLPTGLEVQHPGELQGAGCPNGSESIQELWSTEVICLLVCLLSGETVI